jgi:hypothetical protein
LIESPHSHFAMVVAVIAHLVSCVALDLPNPCLSFDYPSVSPWTSSLAWNFLFSLDIPSIRTFLVSPYPIAAGPDLPYHPHPAALDLLARCTFLARHHPPRRTPTLPRPRTPPSSPTPSLPALDPLADLHLLDFFPFVFRLQSLFCLSFLVFFSSLRRS